MKRNTLLIILTFLQVALFLYAALSKLLDYHEFKRQLNYSPYISSLAPLLAWGLPIGEIVIALFLLIRSTRLIGFYASFLLMCAFTIYLSVMLIFSPMEDVPCPCGGILGEMSWTTHIFFNIVFIAIALTGIFLQKRISLMKSRH